MPKAVPAVQRFAHPARESAKPGSEVSSFAHPARE
jgi:hypothetical protein